MNRRSKKKLIKHFRQLECSFKGMSIEEVAKKLDVTIEKVKEWEKRLSH
ncbi:hypothetical protein [Bacillus wiedmannii]